MILNAISVIINIAVLFIVIGINWGNIKTKINFLNEKINKIEKEKDCFDMDIIEIKQRLARIETKLENLEKLINKKGGKI